MIKMKPHLMAVLFLCGTLVLALACTALPSVSKAPYMPGTYEGTGKGYRGPVHVRVQISSAGIEDIAIVSHGESGFPGLAAMEDLLEQVLETGDTDLDAVSGATYSSRGFLQAVEDAVGKAYEKASVSEK